MEKQPYLCAFVDCARGLVPSLPRLKDFVDMIAPMGYNALQLYVEDVFEVDDEPLFGYMRGRYTKAELKELNAYAKNKGVEVIPCIEALAHLEHIFRWPEYSKIRDMDAVLLAEDERTYTLIENMFKTCRECFDSDIINVSLDEARTLGRGKYLDRHGYVSPYEILKKHMAFLNKLCEKYHYEMIIDSDLFYSFACGEYYPKEPRGLITPEIAATVPERAALNYWDYFGSANYMHKMIESHRDFHCPLWYTASVENWTGIVPHNAVAKHRLPYQMEVARQEGIDNICVCDFGNDGNESSPFSSILGYFLAAMHYRGITDEAQQDQLFFEQFGLHMNEYMLLDAPDTYSHPTDPQFNSEKTMIFNDPFAGFFDDALRFLTDDYADRMAENALKLDELAKRDTPFAYIFRMTADLCRLIRVKAYLGDHTRKAYASGDKEALKAVLPEYDETLRLTEVFYRSFKDYILMDHKDNGLEVQAIRYGGLMQRLKDCKELLISYINGEIDHLDTLDEPVQQNILSVDSLKEWDYHRVVSVNTVGGFPFH